MPEASPPAAAAEAAQRVSVAKAAHGVPAGGAAQAGAGGVTAGLSASHTQLLMDAEESRRRGFAPDEEVVMPVPVWSDSDED